MYIAKLFALVSFCGKMKLNPFKILILLMFALWPVCGYSQESAEQDSSAVHEKVVLFNGVVQDASFAPGEKLNVEILETGEALQTTVGTPFQVKLPEDTLWNVCVTNSDTSGAEKEKCYEVLYLGADSAFSMTLGSDADTLTQFADGSVDSTNASPGDSSAASGDSANAAGVAAAPDSALAPDSADSKNQVAAPDSAAPQDEDISELLNAASAAKVTELKKVVVQLRRRPKRKPGESVVTAKSIKRMPGLAEADVIRSIQALPGVVSSSDFSTKIYVRGGAADQNLFLYDNAVVYSPTHFFGLFSTFLVEGIDDVQFYKSGFPAQYGNRLSSVLKMDGRAGGQDTVEEWFSKSSIKISTFAAQAHTEGHKGDARWVVAGRTTYIGYMLDLLNALDVIDLSLDYEFTDVQGTFMYDFTEDTKMKLSFYVGKDVLDFDPLYMDWGNMAIPLNITHRFNGDWDYNATFAFSRFYMTMEVGDLISIGMDLYSFVGKQWLNYRGVTNHTFTAGYELEYIYDKFWEYIASMKATDIQEPFHHVGYLQDAWKLNPDLLLQYGVRLNYQTAAEHFGVEPRSSLTINLDDDKTLELYGGYYLQYLNSIMFSDQESLNEFYYPATTTNKGTHIKPSSSWLMAVDYKQANIFDGFDATVGVYYKTQNDLKTFQMTMDSTEETSSSDFVMADYFGSAKGYSFGYELSLRHDKGVIFGGINWSQSLSVLRSDDGTKAYFPSWHQPYALKMDLGFNWRGPEESMSVHPKQKDMYVRSSAVLKYSAGMPISDYTGYFYSEEIGGHEYDDEIIVLPGSRNAARQTDYFRIDIKVLDIGRENKWNFSWTFINVTDHENMFYTFYDTSKNPPEKTSVTQFPFLPVMINYEYYF